VKVEPAKVEPVKVKPFVKPFVKAKPVVKEKVVEPKEDEVIEVKETVAPVVDSSKGISSVKARILELQGKGKAAVPADAEASL
jgi:hypothetical protein